MRCWGESGVAQLRLSEIMQNVTHLTSSHHSHPSTFTGYDNSQPNNLAILPVNKKAQMITVTFVNGCRATLRTSGTEPKVKYYAEMIGQPKTPPEEEEANGEEGEEQPVNANQAGVGGGGEGEEEGETGWNLEAEKKRLGAELDAIVKTIIDEWFAL